WQVRRAFLCLLKFLSEPGVDYAIASVRGPGNLQPHTTLKAVGCHGRFGEIVVCACPGLCPPDRDELSGFLDGGEGEPICAVPCRVVLVRPCRFQRSIAFDPFGVSDIASAVVLNRELARRGMVTV